MYAVKNWNEEVIKWLAVALCLAMVGMAVMPVVGGLTILHQSNVGYGLMVYGLSRGSVTAFEVGMVAWEISNYIMPLTPYGALAKVSLML